MTRTHAKPLSWPIALACRTAIAACGLFVVAWTGLYLCPGLAILPMAAKAKTSPYCTGWRAVQDATVKVKQAQAQKAILSHSRPVRTDGAYKLWFTPDGEFWVPDTSDEIIGTLLAQQHRKIYGDSVSGGVKRGDIVLDCGAHVGTYVKTALDAGAAKVIAIEPSPEALECLRRNFRNEAAAGRVVIYPKGVWDEEKRLVFFANGNGAAGDSFVEEGQGSRRIADIPVTTVDKIVRELGLSRVDLIKADIKGAGTRMVKGATTTIARYHPRVVISTEEAPEDPATIHAAMIGISPSYRFRAGPCLFTEGEIRNDTLFFQ